MAAGAPKGGGRSLAVPPGEERGESASFLGRALWGGSLALRKCFAPFHPGLLLSFPLLFFFCDFLMIFWGGTLLKIVFYFLLGFLIAGGFLPPI